MSKSIKAKVLSGRYQGQTVIVTNVSSDELGRQYAACKLLDGTRANIAVKDLEQLQEAPEAEPKLKSPASMPFVSGSIGSRTMNQAKSLVKNRNTVKRSENSEEE